jgi:hypothetical protein
MLPESRKGSAMSGVGKKPAEMCSRAFESAFSCMSKAALIDALWCASQLGTNETAEEIEAQAARNACAALRERGDRVPPILAEMEKRRIDSDGEER